MCYGVTCSLRPTPFLQLSLGYSAFPNTEQHHLIPAFSASSALFSLYLRRRSPATLVKSVVSTHFPLTTEGVGGDEREAKVTGASGSLPLLASHYIVTSLRHCFSLSVQKVTS